MKHAPRFATLLLTTSAIILASPATSLACTACMGDTNSKAAGATNAAIFLLLGFIGGVLGLLVAFGFALKRRAASPLPPHTEFSGHGTDFGTLS